MCYLWLSNVNIKGLSYCSFLSFAFKSSIKSWHNSRPCIVSANGANAFMPSMSVTHCHIQPQDVPPASALRTGQCFECFRFATTGIDFSILIIDNNNYYKSFFVKNVTFRVLEENPKQTGLINKKTNFNTRNGQTLCSANTNSHFQPFSTHRLLQKRLFLTEYWFSHSI